ncbi:MAG TPA: hypothetical protein VKY65_15530 [Alphaproteobacteria bacterium]|nr:hypothetical protein [Alphaproteobacteria bacterium]
MEALLENPNVLGYVLLVALAGVIILRLQASRRRAEEERRQRHPWSASHAGKDEHAAAGEDFQPGSLGRARLQFYMIILAVLALVAAYLIHR